MRTDDECNVPALDNDAEFRNDEHGDGPKHDGFRHDDGTRKGNGDRFWHG